jgi:hypothetical protein
MFVDSMCAVTLTTEVHRDGKPFAKILSIKQRPLMLVVPSGDPKIRDEDHELVRELAIHLAAAFFARRL